MNGEDLGCRGVAFFHDKVSNHFTVEDRRYSMEGDNNTALTLTFVSRDSAVSCFSRLGRVHVHLDAVTGDNGWANIPGNKKDLKKKVHKYVKLISSFGKKYGHGAVTPFLRSSWSNFERFLGLPLTDFNDDIADVIYSRVVGPRPIREVPAGVQDSQLVAQLTEP